MLALVMSLFVVAPGLVAPANAADDYTAAVQTSCNIDVPAVVRAKTAPRIRITVRPNAPAAAAGKRAAAQRAEQPTGTVELSIIQAGTEHLLQDRRLQRPTRHRRRTGDHPARSLRRARQVPHRRWQHVQVLPQQHGIRRPQGRRPRPWSGPRPRRSTTLTDCSPTPVDPTCSGWSSAWPSSAPVAVSCTPPSAGPRARCTTSESEPARARAGSLREEVERTRD